MATAAVSYARENQKRFLEELKELLRIPSISTMEEHKGDVRKAAEYVAAELKRIGFENVEVIPTNGHPLVYADWLHAPANRRRCVTRTTTFSRPIRSTSGRRLRSSRPSATTISTRAAPSTTKASSGCR